VSPARALAATCLLAGLSACAAGPAPTGRAPEPAGGGSAEAVRHEDARFLVTYGGAAFRVNVRYVPLIDESVIAIRQGVGEAREQGWTEIALDPVARFSRVANYADESYEPVVLDIAQGVRERGGICEGGGDIEMAMDGQGQARTLYRSNRRAWIVFALCPEQIAGEG
jgi:hypothetical protein